MPASKTLPAEIADIFAFMMAFSLLENLAVTAVLVVLSVLLPSSWLRDGFALKGFVILLIATMTSILFQKSLQDDYPSTIMPAVSAVIPLVLTLALMAMIRSTPKVQNILHNIQDRTLISKPAVRT